MSRHPEIAVQLTGQGGNVIRQLGLEAGGAVRAGFAHYNTPEEVDRLLEAFASL